MTQRKSQAMAEQFPQPFSGDYYNTAGAALCPAVVRDVMSVFYREMWEQPLASYSKYQQQKIRVRERLAGLMGAQSAEVAITHHTAEGANVVGWGMDWKPGDVLLTLDHEFPSTIYPWLNLQKLKGVQLVLLEEKGGRLQEDKIIEAVRRYRPRMLAMSAVQWCSGYRYDLELIGRVCRDDGVFFFVDAAQALGFCEVDVKKSHISAAAGSTWKWLFGPFGLGYLYLDREWLERIAPVFVGSDSVPDPERYQNFNLSFSSDMRRFEYSTINLAAVVQLDAGLGFLEELELARVRERVFSLQDHALDAFTSRGFQVRGQSDPRRRSGIIAFRHPRIGSQKLASELMHRHQIFTRERDGFVRLAFHLYNNHERFGWLLSCVDELSRVL